MPRPLHLHLPLPSQSPLALSPLPIFFLRCPLLSLRPHPPLTLALLSSTSLPPGNPPPRLHQKNAFILGSTILHLKTLFFSLDLLDLPSSTFQKQPPSIQSVEKYHPVTARCAFLMSALTANPLLFLLIRLCQQGFREYQRCLVHS